MKKPQKKTLLFSVVAVILCCAMLAGTTLAWFTDIEKGNANIITGNLDVELYHKGKTGDFTQVTETTRDLFDDVELWEPGAIAYETFKVKNAGEMALKYKMQMNVLGYDIVNDHNLTEVLKVAMVTGVPTGGRPAWNQIENGVLLNSWSKDFATLAPEAEDTFTLMVYWEPTTHDNDFNMKDGKPKPLTIDLGIVLAATQVENEKDSFDKLYDQDITFDLTNVDPVENAMAYNNAKADGSAEVTAKVAPSLNQSKKTTTVEFAPGTWDEGDRVEIQVNTKNDAFNAIVNGIDTPVASLDVTLLVNDEVKHDWPNNTPATVTTYITAGLSSDLVVKCGNEPMPTTYTPADGKLMFTTTHFSIFDANDTNRTAVAIDQAKDTAYTSLVEAVKASTVSDATVTVKKDAPLNEVVNAINTVKNDPNVPNKDKIFIVIPTTQDTTAPETDVFEAKVGSKYHTTLTGAVNAAEKGATITLLKDVNLSSTLTIGAGKEVTLDLNGKKIESSGTTVHNFGKLTIRDTAENGKIVSTTHCPIAAGDNSVTNIESGIFESVEGAVITGKATGATININGGTFSASDNAVIAGNGSSRDGKENIINISGGTFNGGIKTGGYVACGIYAPWKDIINVSGGTFNITNGAGIVARAGNVNVTGGTFNVTGNATGKVGDSRVVVPCSVFVFDAEANYSAMTADSKITVTGGSFTSAVDCITVRPNDATSRVVVSGGTFSSDPSAYLAYGCNAVEGNGWTVKQAGTAADPIHIKNETDWYSLASKATTSSGTAGKYYVVDRDLDFTGMTKKASLYYFAGNIDFKGHTVSGLNDSNTYTYRYPSLFLYVKGDATINNLKFELPNLGTDKTVKPIGLITGTGTVTLENIAISGNLNMTDNNTGPLVDLIRSFKGTVNLIGCTNNCNMVNNGYSSAFIGGIYSGSNEIVLNAKDCVNYGKILSTADTSSMLISNPTRYTGDSLTLNITNCRNEGQIIAAPGKSSYLVMPYRAGELKFFTEEELKAFETSRDIVNANGGITTSLTSGKLEVTEDGNFDLIASMDKKPNATRFVLAFGFQGTGGLGGGGVTQYAFNFDSRDALVNVPAYRWVNNDNATGAVTAHNEYGTTYYTDAESHYVYNKPGYIMRNQPEVSFIAYDAEGNVMLVNYYTYSK